ncbi:ABC transporter permease subunit [Modestobacter sp. VKM Ac-2986]|uniref:ABC transporter permease subunit n=1 Tax=Modestobacter sp. VKM Ac-2986 TaxID=3004140 RepID=UPI0022AB5A6B|nr:ABC transporter permease subunit [Modestobacter sp. VKM Ac-2986]MCZ2830408.1 ABC transporter permease subunit [Modestobacter sp. VKM Ac-2986]
MSAVLTPPEAPTTRPAGRFGGLLRAEGHRFTARRFIRVLLGLAVLGWIGVLLIGLVGYGSTTPERLAAAEQARQEQVDEINGYREECLASADVPEGVSADDYCGPVTTVEEFELQYFLDPVPFSLSQDGTNGAVAFSAAASVLAFLVAATYVGAEWSSRSMTALLFWETRRARVMGAKIAVVAVAALLVGVVAQLAWLAMAGIWQAAVGDGVALPEGFWTEVLAAQGRGVLLTVCAGLLGFGLTNLVRNTGAALGLGFVYFAVLETAVRIVEPTWQQWLLTNNAIALVFPGGLELYLGYDEITGESITDQLGNMQAGVYMTVVTAVVVGVGVVLFSRRDAQ